MIVLPLIAVAALVTTQDSQPWREVGTTDGVQLEVRTPPGQSFEEIRATAVTPESLESLCSAAFAKGRRKLEGKVKEKVLLRETETEHWSYERVGIPVLSDRDYVLHVKLERPASSGRCDISFETVEDPSRPKIPGVVRLELHGHWSITRTGDGKSLLTYEVFCDPGGGVPPFLAKSSQRSATVELVRRIIDRAHAESGT